MKFRFSGVWTLSETFCLLLYISWFIMSLTPKRSTKGSQTPILTLKKLSEELRSVQTQDYRALWSHWMLKCEKLVDSTGKKLLSLSFMIISLSPWDTTCV